MKPRVPFCWWCGRKLRYSHHVVVDGHVLHKNCAKVMSKTEDPNTWPDVMRDDELLAEDAEGK